MKSPFPMINSRYRSKVKTSCLALSTVLLVGCTTSLRVVQVTDKAVLPRSGAPYQLPFTQFTITANYTVIACEKVSDKDLLDLKLKITGQNVPDPTQEYIIDFGGLDAAFKDTSLSVEYHENGMLKSVNATADDKTAEVAKAIVTTVAKFYGAGAPVAAATGGSTALKASTEKPEIECKENIKQAQINQKALTKKVKQLTNEVDRRIQMLEKATAFGAAMGAHLNKEGRLYSAELISGLYEKRFDLQVATTDLAKTKKMLTLEKTEIWPPDGNTLDGELFDALTAKELKRWFHLNGNPPEDDAKGKKKEIPSKIKNTTPQKNKTEKLARDTKVVTLPDSFASEPTMLNKSDSKKIMKFASSQTTIKDQHLDGGTKDRLPASWGFKPEPEPKTESGRPANTDVLYAFLEPKVIRKDPSKRACGSQSPDCMNKGIKYRIPVASTLSICKTAETADKTRACKGKAFETKDLKVAQLGVLLSLRLENGPFKNQEVEALFNESGFPTKLGTKSTSKGEEVAGLVDSLVDAALKKKEADNPKTPLELLQAEVAELTAQSEIAALKAKLNPPENPDPTAAENTDSTNADAALLSAQAAYLSAEIAMMEAERKIAP